MSDGAASHRFVAAVLREILPWALIVGPFLYVYASHPAGGPRAVGPHLQIVALVWLGLACVRLAAWRWLPGRAVPRALCALLLGSALAVLASYYLLVVIGLWSWGRVASWELVSHYITQLPALAESLDISIRLGVAAVAFLLAFIIVTVDRLLVRKDVLCGLASPGSATMVSAIVVGGLMFVALQAHGLVVYPPLAEREPLTLTFSTQADGASHLSSQVVMSPELADAARADRASYKPSTAASTPNIVLVVADALRADRLGVYGYDRATTPFLSALQRQGQLSLVPQAVAACPESFCGLLAIARAKPLHQLTDQDLSLHEVLKRHGYRIDLILGGDHTNFYGLRKAYGEVDNYFDGSMVHGRSANDDNLVLERLGAMPAWDGKPVLLQVHLMSAHLLGWRDPAFSRYLPAKPYVPWRQGAATDLSKPQPETSNHYDNGVLQLDDVLRRLVSTLAEKQYLRDAIVVVTGDHGEALGERGEYGHAKSVIEPAMRVPLIFLGFGRPAPVIAAPAGALASQVDIAPTLLTMTGMPIPRSWSGSPLQGGIPPRRLAFQQGYFVGVYDSTEPGRILKYWRHVNTGEEHVIDIGRDPAEEHNLLKSLDPARLESLRLSVKPQVASLAR